MGFRFMKPWASAFSFPLLAWKAIASVRRENGLSEHFQMPMPCTVDAIQKAGRDRW